MGFRFQKRLKIAPGINLNFSKNGVGISAGPKGAKIGTGSKGLYTNLGIPGTGISKRTYCKQKGGEKEVETKKVISSGAGQSLLITPRKEIPQVRTTIGTLSLFISIFFISVSVWVFFLLALGGFIFWRTSPEVKVFKLYRQARKNLRKNDTSETIAYLKEVLRLTPGIKTTRFQIAELCMLKKLYQEAAVWYENFLSVSNVGQEEKEEILLNLSLCYREEGEKEKAVETLQRFPEDSLQDIRYITTMGVLFLEMDKPDLAVSVLETGPTRKQKMDDAMKLFRYLLGIAYKKIGENKKAIVQLQKVYVVDSKYQDTSDLLLELKGD